MELYDYMLLAAFKSYLAYNACRIWICKWTFFIKVICTTKDLDDMKTKCLDWFKEEDARSNARIKRAFEVIVGRPMDNL